MKTIEVIRRESTTQQLFFTTKPNKETRQALRAAGFRWNGLNWWKNVNATTVIKPKELSPLLAPIQVEAAVG